ncbi:MAG: lysostaphin resistance A-like protein [Acidimicrobiales bacterium]
MTAERSRVAPGHPRPPTSGPERPAAVPDGGEVVRWGLGDALSGVALTLLVPSLVFAFMGAVAGPFDLDEVPLWGLALFQVPLWVGLLGAPLWASYHKGRRSLATDFGLRWRWTDLPLGLVVGFGGQVAVGLAVPVLYRALGIDPGRIGTSAEELTAEATGAVDVVVLLVVVAIAAPALEELFYRGLWLRALQARAGTGAAVVGSAAVFATLHLQPYDFPALFAFGVLAALLAVRTGRLGPATWAHVAFNLTAVVSLLAGGP